LTLVDTLRQGARPAPLNYKGFPKSVCTSVNDVVCHGIPDATVLKNGDIDPLWPEGSDVTAISKFLRDTLKRPAHEVDYTERYYNRQSLDEPPCVLGYLQVFILSNGDVLTGCYPLEPVGNILRDSLENILSSEAYARQCAAMIRRECPGCTCGVESSLAMKHAASSALHEISRLTHRQSVDKKESRVGVTPVEDAPHA